MPIIVKDREKFFWSKVGKKEEYECWNYNELKDKDGYGRFWNGEKEMKAHRFAYESFHHREIPEELLVCHRCDNPACCNPLHLFLGTNADNLGDMAKKGRSNNKEAIKACARFSAEEIIKIRKLEYKGIFQREVAKLFKTSQRAISRIWRSKTHICKEGYYV